MPFQLDDYVTKINEWLPNNFDPEWIGRIDTMTHDAATILWRKHTIDEEANHGRTVVKFPEIMHFYGELPKFKIGQLVNVKGAHGYFYKVEVREYLAFDGGMWQISLELPLGQATTPEFYVWDADDPLPEKIEHSTGSISSYWDESQDEVSFGMLGLPSGAAYIANANRIELQRLLDGINVSRDDLNMDEIYNLDSTGSTDLNVSGEQIRQRFDRLDGIEMTEMKRSEVIESSQTTIDLEAETTLPNWEISPIKTGTIVRNTRPIGDPDLYQGVGNRLFVEEPPELGVGLQSEVMEGAGIMESSVMAGETWFSMIPKLGWIGVGLGVLTAIGIGVGIGWSSKKHGIEKSDPGYRQMAQKMVKESNKRFLGKKCYVFCLIDTDVAATGK